MIKEGPDNPVAEKFWSLTGDRLKFTHAATENYKEALHFKRALIEAFLGTGTDKPETDQSVIATLTQEQNLLLQLTTDCFLSDHISAMFKHGERIHAASLDGSKPIEKELIRPIEFSTNRFPQLQNFQSPENSGTAPINFIKLVTLFEKGKLKLDRPNDFALVANWLKKIFAQEPDAKLGEKTTNSSFRSIIGATLASNPESVRLIQNILSRQKTFKIGSSSERLMVPIKLLQAFWQIFLEALVDPSHPSFASAYELFATLTNNFDFESPSGEIAHFIDSIAGGLANRHHSRTAGYRLPLPIGQWIKQFYELEDTELAISEADQKLFFISRLLASFIQSSEHDHRSPIISMETALKQIVPYQQIADQHQGTIEMHLFEPESQSDRLARALLGKLELLTDLLSVSSYQKVLELIRARIEPIIEEIVADSDDPALLFPDILENFPVLKQLRVPLTLSAAELNKLPQLFGDNLIRITISPSLRTSETGAKFDLQVYFRAVKTEHITAAEQYFRFTLESTPESFYLEADLIELDAPEEQLDQLRRKLIYFGLLELLQTSLVTAQTNFDQAKIAKSPKKQPTTNGTARQITIASATSSSPIPNLPRRKRGTTAIGYGETEKADSASAPETKPRHIQVNLITLPGESSTDLTTPLANVEIDRAFDLAPEEVAKQVNAFLAQWNQADQLYKLEFLTRNSNQARLKLTINGHYARIMLEKRKIAGHTRFIVTAIKHRKDAYR